MSSISHLDDYRQTSDRVQVFHVVTRNMIGLLTEDAFTQANSLPTISKVGVLGGSVAFTRGNNLIGGPARGDRDRRCRPLGIFTNDAVRPRDTHDPERGPYLHGSGTCIGVRVHETSRRPYQAGDEVYASINGYLTNELGDSYEASAGVAPTVIGIVRAFVPEANSSLLVIDMRI